MIASPAVAGNGLIRIIDRMPAPVARRFRADSVLARVARPLINRFAPQGETVVTVRSGPGEGLKLPVRLKSEKYYWTGAHEPHVQAALERLLESGMTFWDVGAHIGFVTTMAARMVGDTGRVVSFEPMPETADRLRRSVELNGFGNVTVLQCAVDDFAGEKTLHPPKASGEGDIDATQPTVMWTLVDEIGAAGGVTVQCRRLSDVAEQFGAPDLIKIDAEGAEVEVLASGLDLLEQHGSRVIIEISDDETLGRARALLPEATFKLIGANHWLID